MHQKLSNLGVQPMPMTPAEFDAYVRKELEQNAVLVKVVRHEGRIASIDPSRRRPARLAMRAESLRRP